mmetsp:Transcript_106299/g.300604  ORF Transcript_106299/g.300604 Transcript_106299/m.300604 type:complete len:269 (+) Transcript_106299:1085-1891(+)
MQYAVDGAGHAGFGVVVPDHARVAAAKLARGTPPHRPLVVNAHAVHEEPMGAAQGQGHDLAAEPNGARLLFRCQRARAGRQRRRPAANGSTHGPPAGVCESLVVRHQRHRQPIGTAGVDRIQRDEALLAVAPVGVVDRGGDARDPILKQHVHEAAACLAPNRQHCGVRRGLPGLVPRQQHVALDDAANGLLASISEGHKVARPEAAALVVHADAVHIEPVEGFEAERQDLLLISLLFAQGPKGLVRSGVLEPAGHRLAALVDKNLPLL